LWSKEGQIDVVELDVEIFAHEQEVWKIKVFRFEAAKNSAEIDTHLLFLPFFEEATFDLLH
jgi:hypothetical protein